MNRLRTIQDSYRALLEETGLATAFQTRLGNAPGDGEIYVAAVTAAAAADTLAQVPVEPNLGAAVLVIGDTPTAQSTITIEPSGRATLLPLGLTFEAVGLPLITASEIAVLLDEAASPDRDLTTPDDPSPAPRCETHIDIDTGADDPGADVDLGLNEVEEDFWSSGQPTRLIRVLGVPRVEGIERVGPLELGIVTFIACNGGTATPDQVINAIWGGKAIEQGTFLNRLTKTRNTLPDMLLGRANGTRDLALAEGVTTDLQQLEQLIGRSRQVSSGEAIELLTQALALVEGVPFDDVHFDWAHDRQHHAHACQLIEQATLKLVDLALDHGDIDIAREACRRGLIGLPLNEPIYCARMRVESAAGNRSGVQEAFRDLRRGLSELDDRIDTYEPLLETVMLYEQLAGTTKPRPTA